MIHFRIKRGGDPKRLEEEDAAKNTYSGREIPLAILPRVRLLLCLAGWHRSKKMGNRGVFK
jgi:hypothetical protein